MESMKVPSWDSLSYRSHHSSFFHPCDLALSPQWSAVPLPQLVALVFLPFLASLLKTPSWISLPQGTHLAHRHTYMAFVLTTLGGRADHRQQWANPSFPIWISQAAVIPSLQRFLNAVPSTSPFFLRVHLWILVTLSFREKGAFTAIVFSKECFIQLFLLLVSQLLKWVRKSRVMDAISCHFSWKSALRWFGTTPYNFTFILAWYLVKSSIFT